MKRKNYLEKRIDALNYYVNTVRNNMPKDLKKKVPYEFTVIDGLLSNIHEIKDLNYNLWSKYLLYRAKEDVNNSGLDNAKELCTMDLKTAVESEDFQVYHIFQDIKEQSVDYEIYDNSELMTKIYKERCLKELKNRKEG